MMNLVLELTVCVLLGMGSFSWREDSTECLVCVAPGYEEAVQPLVEWRRSKGIWTEARVISGSSEAVRADIRSWYTRTTPPTLKYVLLVGSPDQIISHQIPWEPCWEDCYFGDMDGDYRMEIAVGRLPARTAQESRTMVAKVLAYERPPADSDTAWFLKGTTIVKEGTGDEESLYYWPDTRSVHAHWLSEGYSAIDSLSERRGDNSADVDSAVRDGRSFLAYRGSGTKTWYTPFHQVNPTSWHNGAKLPIVVSGSCQTVLLDSGGGWMQSDSWMRFGSPESLGGIGSYFGTTSSGNLRSPYRSAVFRSFFNAIFDREEYLLGRAAMLARDSAYQQWPGDSLWYLEWNLLGDPTMPVWVGGIPRLPTVVHPDIIVWSAESIRVAVSVDGRQVKGARVCIRRDPDIYSSAVTDDSGIVVLSVPRAREEGWVLLTVSEGHAVGTPRTPILPRQDTVWIEETGWTERVAMPRGPSGKPVKSGGWLASDPSGGLAYGAKGNKSGDFYRFDLDTDTWVQLWSIQEGCEGKLPSKGCRGACDGQGHVYMVKGNNTLGFWRYNVTGDSWTQLQDVPRGVSNKRVKDGADLAFTTVGDTGYTYLLKGNRYEFYRFNCATGQWETLACAPGYPHKWYEGSFLVFDGDHTFYAHKAKHHELYAYNVLGCPRFDGQS